MSDGGSVDAVEALTRLGGIAWARDIVGLSSRGSLRRAVRAGDVVRVGPGRYAFTVSHAEAQALDGVVSHLSAALHWGWEVKWPPDLPWVTVARSRHITAARRKDVHLVYADVDDVIDGVTSPLRTVIDCARRLPFDEALAVADSGLRDGRVTGADLAREAAVVRGRAAAQCRRVAAAATAKAANPFESVLRAIALDHPFDLVPQVPVSVSGQTYHPDLVDGTAEWFSKRIRGGSTPAGKDTPATAAATTHSCWTAGWSCASRGTRSCTLPTTCAPCSPVWPGCWSHEPAEPGPAAQIRPSTNIRSRVSVCSTSLGTCPFTARHAQPSRVATRAAARRSPSYLSAYGAR